MKTQDNIRDYGTLESLRDPSGATPKLKKLCMEIGLTHCKKIRLIVKSLKTSEMRSEFTCYSNIWGIRGPVESYKSPLYKYSDEEIKEMQDLEITADITISPQNDSHLIKLYFEGKYSEFEEEIRYFTEQARIVLGLPTYEEEREQEEEELRKSWDEYEAKLDKERLEKYNIHNYGMLDKLDSQAKSELFTLVGSLQDLSIQGYICNNSVNPSIVCPVGLFDYNWNLCEYILHISNSDNFRGNPEIEAQITISSQGKPPEIKGHEIDMTYEGTINNFVEAIRRLEDEARDFLRLPAINQ